MSSNTVSRMGAAESSAVHGSRTLVLDPTATGEVPPTGDEGHVEEEDDGVVGVIPLTGARLAGGPGRIQWDESVVDNEGMGKKSSKICCIFRKQRSWDESDSDSSEFSSDDDDSSDEDGDKDSGHGHEHGHGCNHGHGGHRHRHHKSPGPNAYERQPKYKKRPGPPAPAGPSGPSGGGGSGAPA
ncbi:Type 1 phosphatases regulator ypi1 [Blastocladiella emersonii ATCC 22665]|nr:Type 1 phosphatases regulator ypi1 [Blastocladiella emersonii ATCC 22665]